MPNLGWTRQSLRFPCTDLRFWIPGPRLRRAPE